MHVNNFIFMCICKAMGIKMKKFIFSLILLISSGILFAEELFCDNYIANRYAETYPDYIITKNNVTVHDDFPGGNVLFKLNAGDIVHIEEYFKESEELVKGTYAWWFKISCSKGEGYVLGRYMTPNFIEVDFDDKSNSEYICYMAYFKWRILHETDWVNKRYVKDEFLYIKGRNVYLINSSEFPKFTLFSEETPVTDFSVFLSMDYDTGYEEPTVLVATEKIQIDKKIYYRATLFNFYETSRTEKPYYYACELLKTDLFDEDEVGIQPYVIFPKKTYSVRWHEWENNEIDYNLYPCEFWEAKLHVNK